MKSNFVTNGMKHLLENDYKKAEVIFREAILHNPCDFDAYSNLGVALYMQSHFSEAVEILSTACELRPNHRETLLTYGFSLWRANKFFDARKIFEQIDTLQSRLALGQLCLELDDRISVIKYANDILREDSNNIAAHYLLFEVHHRNRNEIEAMAECDILVNLSPSYRYKRAQIMLSYGNDAGWQELEYCYVDRVGTRLLKEKTVWDGKYTRHLFVTFEQGFGDIIQFMRFIPLAAERCEKLSVFLPKSLRDIARNSFRQSNIDFCDKIPPQFDHYCLIMSLGYLLNCTDSIPSEPYLITSVDYHGNQNSIMKVGLVWSGRKTHQNDAIRSIPFEKIERLLEVPVDFFSLQYPSDLELSPYRITNLPVSGDWNETAELINSLDLVIAVDTAVAHMAGALGKPVWLLNRYDSDWRWGLFESFTPWYPSMTIFRQTEIGNWDSVIDEVKIALETKSHDYQIKH